MYVVILIMHLIFIWLTWRRLYYADNWSVINGDIEVYFALRQLIE